MYDRAGLGHMRMQRALLHAKQVAAHRLSRYVGAPRSNLVLTAVVIIIIKTLPVLLTFERRFSVSLALLLISPNAP